MHRNPISKIRLETLLRNDYNIAGLVPDDYFELIKYVVDNYPGFNDAEYGFDAPFPEEQAALLYASFGIRVFVDMYDTASECKFAREETENAKEKCKARIAEMHNYRLKYSRVTKKDLEKLSDLNLSSSAVVHVSKSDDNENKEE